ncbi:polysaccharide pyruvyl transferase family protein [Coraliomargarita akajimensis]|uniref:Polysaccharide pyruvyl transferase domain-containing protein n=1 Tax=Coraliomargarita akajimensis (strain DSM 45221 / IAM 15411 / JCM 23193 / KCTC 12865 / 04OKA010-24) TaxID=583355 RepID=D5EKU6_CORAD|nr:polysaccharide pyruvyl transferase family protein [Coraliomargarita akajimensis]ADE55003.1 hypothetical protein Caka_1985 [Coraliomargarita akajimensis DSM 45221]
MKRIAVVSGFWGTNIGNAFFNVGGKYIAEQMFPGESVEWIQDQPGYWTFWDQEQGNQPNDLVLLQYLECDAIVIQGPLFTTTFRKLWEPTFKALKARGTKLIFLSAALFRFTDEEKEQNLRFLEEIQPDIICTRDRPSYEVFKDCAPATYAGIDSAFFCPRAYRPFELSLKPYIAVNYDRFPEPDISYVKGAGKDLPAGGYEREFEALDAKWGLRYPARQMKLAHKGKKQSYLGALLDRRKLPESIGEYTVVRPEHRFNPHINWKIYKQPNAVCSDEPFTYLTVYAGSSLTITDRVHACVATLAYGNPAILYKHSPRGQLFDRLGLGDVGERVRTLDPKLLEQEQEAELAFLKEAAATLF